MTLDTPVNGQIFQRDLTNRAIVPISGICATIPQRVACRFVPIEPGKGIATEWQTIEVIGDRFHGEILVYGGLYRLELYASTNESSNTTEVGIGECFVVAGHSVAAGGAESIDGSTLDSVRTVPELPSTEHYARTGDAEELPKLSFVPYKSGVSPGPFGAGTYFWSKFAELVSQRENVPVLVLNAAFGGSSLEHWGLSAQRLQFEHSFISSTAGMPYANLRNSLSRYLAFTGCRAILADQGQNDYNRPDENLVFNDYQTFITQARVDSHWPNLACVVNRQTPFHTETQIRRVQERVIAEVPNCFAGPDYDTGLDDNTDRVDHIHLSLSGQAKAAQLWANAVSPAFLAKSIPFVLRPTPTDIVSLVGLGTTTQASLTPIATSTKPDTLTKVALVAGAVAIGAILFFVFGRLRLR